MLEKKNANTLKRNMDIKIVYRLGSKKFIPNGKSNGINDKMCPWIQSLWIKRRHDK